MYEKFETLLKERGITAYQVSKDTGIATATLTEWKNGKYTPNLNKLMILADYFEVPLEHFIRSN